ncbi:hypothetical protein [Streptomyces sp. NBC_01244]|uniref:hypothetical protein n=1 Tax=Streptomyces sp. NBC_01244 TaxID=2903797 RepID=UPI002E0F1BB0|nr:hypothetical protein OG247_03750 [Streptomyces sp. NBC_01244]
MAVAAPAGLLAMVDRLGPPVTAEAADRDAMAGLLRLDVDGAPPRAVPAAWTLRGRRAW